MSVHLSRLRKHLAGWAALAIVCLAGAAPPASAAGVVSSLVFKGELDSAAFERAGLVHREVRIAYSPGGSGAAAMSLAALDDVVIDGVCNSACAWAFVLSQNACFTKRASFGFHAAHDPGTGRLLSKATNYWLELVPASFQPRLERLKASSHVVEISAAEMAQYYPDRRCNAENHPRKPAPAVIVASLRSAVTRSTTVLASAALELPPGTQGAGIERLHGLDADALIIDPAATAPPFSLAATIVANAEQPIAPIATQPPTFTVVADAEIALPVVATYEPDATIVADAEHDLPVVRAYAPQATLVADTEQGLPLITPLTLNATIVADAELPLAVIASHGWDGDDVTVATLSQQPPTRNRGMHGFDFWTYFDRPRPHARVTGGDAPLAVGTGGRGRHLQSTIRVSSADL